MLKRRKWNFVLLGTAICLASSLFVVRSALPRKASAPQTARANTESVQSLDLHNVNFEELRWDDLRRVMTVAGQETAGLADVLRATENCRSDTAKYLRGLVLLANSQPQVALETFDQIALAEIPPDHLYVPFRLHDQLRPGEQNPYVERLRPFVEQGDVSAVIRARVLIRDGRLKDGIQAYLSSDPASWTLYDAACLERVYQHAGFQNEVRRLVLAALKAGRVSSKHTASFSKLALGRLDESSEQQMRERIREAGGDQQAFGTAVASAKQILDTRRLFIRREYRALIDQQRDVEPVEMTSESVLLLFLSALHERDRSLANRCGQELKRRESNPEVYRWVESLTKTAFQGS